MGRARLQVVCVSSVVSSNYYCVLEMNRRCEECIIRFDAGKIFALFIWHRALPKVGGLCNPANIISFSSKAQRMVAIKFAPLVFDKIGCVLLM